MLSTRDKVAIYVLDCVPFLVISFFVLKMIKMHKILKRVSFKKPNMYPFLMYSCTFFYSCDNHWTTKELFLLILFLTVRRSSIMIQQINKYINIRVKISIPLLLLFYFLISMGFPSSSFPFSLYSSYASFNLHFIIYYCYLFVHCTHEKRNEKRSAACRNSHGYASMMMKHRIQIIIVHIFIFFFLNNFLQHLLILRIHLMNDAK